MSLLNRRGAGPDQLLLPASSVFIWLSLFFALLLTLMLLATWNDLTHLGIVRWVAGLIG